MNDSMNGALESMWSQNETIKAFNKRLTRDKADNQMLLKT